MRSVPEVGGHDPLAELTSSRNWEEDGSRFTETVLRMPDRTVRSLDRRDQGVNTRWRIEHLLKTADDLRAWADLPAQEFAGEVDGAGVLAAEERIGDAGIVMIDTPDPLCIVADLLPMSEYLVTALTEPAVMHRALERVAAWLQPKTEAVARVLPGRLWRIYGPEYASPPYLAPELFREYVVRYDAPMVEAIRRHGGYARIHSHGRLEGILDDIAEMGTDGLDPIEPPPQGDVTLAEVRRRYGRQMVLFGNLEVSDIESMPTAQFAEKVRTGLREGTEGDGRGFVLMPSACPYGREISALTLRNYEEMVRLAEAC
jgi:hypothetical protein